MGLSLSLSLAFLKLSHLVQADLELTLLSTLAYSRCASRQPHRFPLLLCADVPTLPFSDSLDISKKKKSKSLVRMKSGTLGTNMSQAMVL